MSNSCIANSVPRSGLCLDAIIGFELAQNFAGSVVLVSDPISTYNISVQYPLITPAQFIGDSSMFVDNYDNNPIIISGETVFVNPCDPTMLKAYLLDNVGAVDRGCPTAAAVEYVHTQAVLSTTWSITHNLNKRPSSVVTYVGGQEVETTVIFVDVNNIQVCFTTPNVGITVIS